ncbi:hypothetical protein CEXT_761141 [Caerostris extrusa]|uniref:Uncharacterized protein n=1 Tax=Caerostris extrusa TaxID=172846 RepID=A0AAV4R1F1_CAEEX|nr:hypothetical protein CEXT_761141 [Caerostris extrusa]
MTLRFFLTCHPFTSHQAGQMRTRYSYSCLMDGSCRYPVDTGNDRVTARRNRSPSLTCPAKAYFAGVIKYPCLCLDTTLVEQCDTSLSQNNVLGINIKTSQV